MIFFDSEAYTEIAITDQEIQRATRGEKVEKPHVPYLASATYYHRRKDKNPIRKQLDYYGEGFLERFWTDVDAYARSNERTWIFAHNAKYDIQVTQGVYLLVQLGYQVTGFSDANPFILKLTKEITHDSKGNLYMQLDKKTGIRVPTPRRKKLVILSSTNYYSQSLASLGEIFKLPKLDFPHGKIVDMSDPADREQALEYVHRDVDILETAMLSFIAFIEREDLGPFGLTVAGQAFTAFRHRFVEDESIFIHSNPQALEVERRAYAGGRNECFRLGKIPEPVIVLDINSMYPHVMATHRYPTRLLTFWRESTPEKVLSMIMDDYLICCDVVLDTGDQNIFHQRSSRLIFPVSTFETTLTTPELIVAFERGMVRKVRNVCVYEGDTIFASYVDYFYTARLEASAADDEVHAHLFKMFLTNLYGKFGQKNETWEKTDEADPTVIDMQHVFANGRHEWVKVFGGGVWMRNTDEDDLEAFNSFPGIAAHVTGYARMLIWKVIETAGRANVYYTDTDSVFVNAAGNALLEAAGMLDNKRLGALKREKAGFLWLNGCKDYMGVWELENGDRKHAKYRHHAWTRKPRSIPLTRPQRRRVGSSWRWGKRRTRAAYPRTVTPWQLYWKEIKIKGIPKNAVPLEPDAAGHLRFAVTQWGGFTDRFRKRDFQHYENKVIIKTLKREYTKASIIDGVIVQPFKMDYAADQEAQARKVLEDARKETAATVNEDPIRTLCLHYGYIKVPADGERYAGEYAGLPKVAKVKYFRRRGVDLDIWAHDNGLDVRTLLDQLRG
ncbi:DNA polymerase [Paenibacillus sp. FSL R7-0302]|uniref:DNA polymerase n=1 Tax=Paenibacillus sp. FSL R7-0302 TaxID=2921681 RepID=UPI0030F8FF0F